MTYSFKLKKWCVRKQMHEDFSVPEIARNRKIPRKTIYRWLWRFRKSGYDGLQNNLGGRKPDQNNVTHEKTVVGLWNKCKYNSPKMKQLLQVKGINLSQRKIQRIYNKHCFKMNRRNRPSQIKFMKYEWPKPNMLWHADWTNCPFTGQKLIAFINKFYELFTD